MGLEQKNGQRKKIGLALGSGVARGIAHIGVLQVLEKEGIPVDMIAGTSIGSIIGALSALGKTADEILEIARKVGAHRFNYLVDLKIPRNGLIGGKKIEDRLKEFYGDAEFSDCKKPFKCVATDIDDGKEIIFSEGKLWEAVRASISVPVIISPANWRERILVDGALVNPVPVNILRDMGAEKIIAVNVMPDRAKSDARDPNIFDIITQTLYILSYHYVQESVGDADILIEPDVVSFSLTDFKRVDECVAKGVEAAEEAIPRIRKMLLEQQSSITVE